MPRAYSTNEDDRREKLAANIADLTRLPEMIRGMLLTGKLATKHIVTDRFRLDEAAVELTCPLLTAACVLDTIRTRDRNAGVYPTRVYLRRTVAWTKLSGSVLLSVVENNEVKLNPELFPLDVRPVPICPPPTAPYDALL